MNYTETLAYLDSLICYQKQMPEKYESDKFSLDGTLALVEGLGRPDRNYPSIHVAGTDGKGSTCAFTERICREFGLRTGLYTSPHLVSYPERIRLNGTPISEEDFADEITHTRQILEKSIADGTRPVPGKTFATVFEILTAAGFNAFARWKVDVAVLETGLGGRLDSTNIVSPTVTVITPIDKEHAPLLGNTLAEIAGEKAGIIKPGVPLVLAPQRPEAEEVFDRVAKEKGSPIRKVKDLYETNIVSRSQAGYKFEFRRVGEAWQKATTRLIGDHQVTNALVAMEAVRQFCLATGRKFDDERCVKAIPLTQWPGRTELHSMQASNGKEVSFLMDSAHTGQAATALRKTLEQIKPGVKFLFLIGMSIDKEIASFFQNLMTPDDELVTTASDSPRAAPPERLMEIARNSLGIDDRGSWKAIWDRRQAFEFALERAESSGRFLCIAGSVYLIGAMYSIVTESQYP